MSTVSRTCLRITKSRSKVPMTWVTMMRLVSPIKLRSQNCQVSIQRTRSRDPLIIMAMLAPKNKEDYVIAVSGRCAVSASELRKHTLDRLKELWAVVRPPKRISALPANWKKSDVQGLRELYSRFVVEDLGRDQDFHWARWNRSKLVMELELWSIDAAEASQMDRDLEVSGDGPLCTQCRIPMLERVNRLTREPFWGCRRFPSCRVTLPAEYDGRPTKEVQAELEASEKTKEKDQKFLPLRRSRPRKATIDPASTATSSDGSWMRAGPIPVEEDDVSEDEKISPKDVNTNLTKEEAEMILQMRIKKKAAEAKGKGNLDKNGK